MSLPSHIKHITDAASLTTTHEATRAGFISIALEKSRRANPHIAKARALREKAGELSGPDDIIKKRISRDQVLAASGLSVKALKYLDEKDCDLALVEFVENCLIPAGDAWLDELVFRYLLTQGDALGGEMRNVVGRIGDEKFLEFLIAALQVSGCGIRWLHKTTGKWAELGEEAEAIKYGKGLEWSVGNEPRTMLFNVRVPLVDKNVDSIVLNCEAEQARRKKDPLIKSPHSYIALGELKGGIDPAGADEHWKTAGTTLSRIGSGFAGAHLNPKRYFVGAAIETAMAKELVKQLKSGQLANAANLTKSDQMAAISEWLIKL